MTAPKLGDVFLEGKTRWRCIAQWDGKDGWVPGSRTAKVMVGLATRYAFDRVGAGGHYLCCDNPFDAFRPGGAMVKVEPTRSERVANALDWGWQDTSWSEDPDMEPEVNRRHHEEEYESNLFRALVGDDVFNELDEGDKFLHADMWMWLAEAIDRLVTVAPLMEA